MSSYQALYRVWRPQRFEDVAGQTMITQTLKNAIANHTPAHAYLFTGPRGTGKTSVAKIFAKAVNCPHSQDGEPCNECEICQEITEGSLGDVIEIDAASNNGVDEIREIREKANYAPTRAEYKVYIIDEVHMLSMGAFNALLKTLEEPPAKVIFILATTEPHKIPATIISRTQRFDFRRITQQTMIERMEYILNEEHIPYDEEALRIIAQTAEGGMRDALSILDQVISYVTDRVTAEAVREITGSITQELLLEYLTLLYEKQTEQALHILNQLLAEGKDATRFIEDGLLICRDLLLEKSVSSEQELHFKIAQDNEQFKTTAQELTADFLYEVIHVFNETQQVLKTTTHKEIYLEVATIRLSVEEQEAESGIQSAPVSQPVSQVNSKEQAALMQEMQKMKRELEQLKQATKQPKEAAPKETQQKLIRKQDESQTQVISNQSKIFEVLNHATHDDRAFLLDLWPDFISQLEVAQSAVMNNGKPVAASPNTWVITFEYEILLERFETDPQINESLNRFLSAIDREEVEIIGLTTEQWKVVRQNYILERKQAKKGIPADFSEEEKQEFERQQQEKEEKQAVVDEAINLFGEDAVNIMEEDK